MNSYEKNKQHILKYQKHNIRQISLKLTMNTDADIIEHLDKQENVQGYIKGLIREDMKKAGA